MQNGNMKHCSEAVDDDESVKLDMGFIDMHIPVNSSSVNVTITAMIECHKSSKLSACSACEEF
jgi:hypothetical protein